MEILVLVSCLLGYAMGSLTVFLVYKKKMVYEQKIEQKIPIEQKKVKRKKEDEPKNILDGVGEMLGYDGKVK